MKCEVNFVFIHQIILYQKQITLLIATVFVLEHNKLGNQVHFLSMRLI